MTYTNLNDFQVPNKTRTIETNHTKERNKCSSTFDDGKVATTKDKKTLHALETLNDLIDRFTRNIFQMFTFLCAFSLKYILW